ncbi:hypothetical protein BGZ83_001530 [Gryganskiella cystojenkinii]|nr:hypothetical protein BGZ83_001530 [Gryganskiella cystojenkinii]
MLQSVATAAATPSSPLLHRTRSTTVSSHHDFDQSDMSSTSNKRSSMNPLAASFTPSFAKPSSIDGGASDHSGEYSNSNRPSRRSTVESSRAAMVTVLGAVDVLNLPPIHIELSPDAYLFEFKSEPGGVQASQDMTAFKTEVQGMKTVVIRQEFNMLFAGISVLVGSPIELKVLMNLEGVASVAPITIVSPPEKVNPTRNALVTSALNMTGVTRAHAELELTGKGIKVGIIDTGVDFTHPALGGKFGPGYKVAYGWDFVGDAFNGKSTPVPGPIPMDCAGHGTHVAGIVAAKTILGAYRVLGCNGSSNDDVILAALERAATDKMDIINLSIGEPNGWPFSAVARAVGKLREFGIMVTVSNGNENTQGLFSANYVGEGRGVLAVASYINTRAQLSYFMVPSLPNYQFLYAKSDVPGLNTTLPLVAQLNGTDLGTGCAEYKADLIGKVVVVQRGDCLFSLKAQNALANGAIGILFVNNVAGSLVASVASVPIVSGSISNVEGKKLFAQLLTDSGSDTATGWTKEVATFFSESPQAFIDPAGGTASLFSSYGLDNELRIKPDIGAPGENIYSTWLTNNGSYTTLSGTSMSAPHMAGSLALALEQWRKLTADQVMTWETVEKIYTTFKNTAEPAHVFKNHEKFDIVSSHPTIAGPNDSNSGRPINNNMDGQARVDSVAKQGAGMANVFRALTSLAYALGSEQDDPTEPEDSWTPIRRTFVTPAMIELNDTEFHAGDAQWLTIQNFGPEAVTYELSHLPAEALHELQIESKEIKLKNMAEFNFTAPSLEKDLVLFGEGEATVTFSADSIKVSGSGGIGRIAVHVEEPTNLPSDQHYIYSGYVVIKATGESSEAIHVPYAGVKGNMKALPIFLRPTEEEENKSNQTKNCQVLGSSMVNKTDYIYTLTPQDLPILTFCIQNPTKFLSMDVLGQTADGHGGDHNSGFTLVGRVASNDFVPRSLITLPITAVQWDGTVDLEDGLKNTGASRNLAWIRTPTTAQGGGELPHHGPDRDLIYGMSAQFQDDDGDGIRKVTTGTRLVPLIQKRQHQDPEREVSIKGRRPKSDTQDQENKEDDDIEGKGKTQDSENGKGRKQEDPDEDDPDVEREKIRNQHLLKTESKETKNTKIDVPDGLYRLRLRGLRILGDIENPEDYDVWTTPTFEIRRAKVGAVGASNPLPPEKDVPDTEPPP